MEFLKKLGVDKSWTLFLDRDGVINLHFPKDYVKNWNEFYFLENAISAIVQLSKIFGRIIIVTNQQGVGKMKMSEESLNNIHKNMLSEITAAGGHIDSVYAATCLENNDPMGIRKPKIGMAMMAQSEFPEIDFNKSVMVGDSISDMQFGRNAGMFTVYVSENVVEFLEGTLVDYTIPSLGALVSNDSR